MGADPWAAASSGHQATHRGQASTGLGGAQGWAGSQRFESAVSNVTINPLAPKASPHLYTLSTQRSIPVEQYIRR